jgi:hypothetical protein
MKGDNMFTDKQKEIIDSKTTIDRCSVLGIPADYHSHRYSVKTRHGTWLGGGIALAICTLYEYDTPIKTISDCTGYYSASTDILDWYCDAVLNS